MSRPDYPHLARSFAKRETKLSMTSAQRGQDVTSFKEDISVISPPSSPQNLIQQPRDQPFHPASASDISALREAVAAAFNTGHPSSSSLWSSNTPRAMSYTSTVDMFTEAPQDEQTSSDILAHDARRISISKAEQLAAEAAQDMQGNDAIPSQSQLPHYHPGAPGTPWPKSPPLLDSSDLLEPECTGDSHPMPSARGSTSASKARSHKIPERPSSWSPSSAPSLINEPKIETSTQAADRLNKACKPLNKDVSLRSASEMSIDELHKHLSKLEVPPPKYRPRRRYLESKVRLMHMKNDLHETLHQRYVLMEQELMAIRSESQSQVDRSDQESRVAVLRVQNADYEEQDVLTECQNGEEAVDNNRQSNPEEYGSDVMSQNHNVETFSSSDSTAFSSSAALDDEILQLDDRVEKLMVVINELDKVKNPRIELSCTGPKTKNMQRARIDDDLWTEHTGRAPGIRRMSGFGTIYDTERTILTPVVSECSEVPTLSPRSSRSNLSIASTRSTRSVRSARSDKAGRTISKVSIMQTLAEADDSDAAGYSYSINHLGASEQDSNAVISGSVQTDAGSWHRDLEQWARHTSLPRYFTTREVDVNDIDVSYLKNSQRDRRSTNDNRKSTSSVSTKASSTVSRPGTSQTSSDVHPGQSSPCGTLSPKPQSSLTVTPMIASRATPRKPPSARKTRQEHITSRLVGDEWSGRRGVTVELLAAERLQQRVLPVVHASSQAIGEVVVERPLSPEAIVISPPSPMLRDSDDLKSASERYEPEETVRDEHVYAWGNKTIEALPQVQQQDFQIGQSIPAKSHRNLGLSRSARQSGRPRRSASDVEAQRVKMAARDVKEVEKAARYHQRHIAIDAKRQFQAKKDELHSRMSATKDEDVRAQLQWELAELYASYAWGEANDDFRNKKECPSLGAPALAHALRIMYEALYAAPRKDRTSLHSISMDPNRWFRYGQLHVIMWGQTGGKSHLDWGLRAFNEAIKLAGDKTEQAGNFCAGAAQNLLMQSNQSSESLQRIQSFWQKSTRCETTNAQQLAWRFSNLAHSYDMATLQALGRERTDVDPTMLRALCIDAIEKAFSLDPTNASHLERLKYYKACQEDESESLEESGDTTFEDEDDSEEAASQEEARHSADHPPFVRNQSAPMVLQSSSGQIEHTIELIEHSDHPRNCNYARIELPRQPLEHNPLESAAPHSEDMGSDGANIDGNEFSSADTQRAASRAVGDSADVKEPGAPTEKVSTSLVFVADGEPSLNTVPETEQLATPQGEHNTDMFDLDEGRHHRRSRCPSPSSPHQCAEKHEGIQSQMETRHSVGTESNASGDRPLPADFRYEYAALPPRHSLHTAESRSGSDHGLSQSSSAGILQTLELHQDAIARSGDVLRSISTEFHTRIEDSAHRVRANEEMANRRFDSLQRQASEEQSRLQGDLVALRATVDQMQARIQDLETWRRMTVTRPAQNLPWSTSAGDNGSSAIHLGGQVDHRLRFEPDSTAHGQLLGMSSSTRPQSVDGSSDDPPPSFHSRIDDRRNSNITPVTALPSSSIPTGETFATFDTQAMLERGAMLFGLYSLHQLAHQTGLQTPMYPPR